MLEPFIVWLYSLYCRYVVMATVYDRERGERERGKERVRGKETEREGGEGKREREGGREREGVRERERERERETSLRRSHHYCNMKCRGSIQALHMYPSLHNTYRLQDG